MMIHLRVLSVVVTSPEIGMAKYNAMCEGGKVQRRRYGQARFLILIVLLIVILLIERGGGERRRIKIRSRSKLRLRGEKEERLFFFSSLTGENRIICPSNGEGSACR
jgi:hypothetical protein